MLLLLSSTFNVDHNVLLWRNNNKTMIINKKLFRSTKNKILGGVCGGFAEFFEIDITLVRLLMVFLILTGIGIPFYIIAWAIMPVETTTPPAEGPSNPTNF